MAMEQPSAPASEHYQTSSTVPSASTQHSEQPANHLSQPAPMATAALKTLVATGASSGLGFELVKQLLAQPTAWSMTLAARSPETVLSALSSVPRASAESCVTVLPVDLTSLATVRTFALETLEKLGGQKLDYLLLNAGLLGGDSGPKAGKKYHDAYVVNHLSQHYLVHLLKDKLADSATRIVFVSSGAIRNAADPSKLEESVAATAPGGPWQCYADHKFIQLLGAHYWRRQLSGTPAVVVAVSPGLIPQTGLGRHVNWDADMAVKDAKTVPEGAQSIYAALVRDDLPEDPDRIFLTSWGEWWGKEVYEKSLDRELQDKWCPSREEIERDMGIDV